MGKFNHITTGLYKLFCAYADIPEQDQNHFARVFLGEDWTTLRPCDLKFMYPTPADMQKTYKKWVLKGRPSYEQICDSLNIDPKDR